MKLTTLCYIKNGGKTLMLHRNKKEKDIHKGKWNGVGGKFEDGESAMDCLIREVREESGLSVKSAVLRAVITYPKFKDDEDYYVYLFVCDDFEGELIECNEGDLEWIDDDKVRELNLWEGDHIFMDYMEKYPFFMAKFEYVDKKLIGHSLEYHV